MSEPRFQPFSLTELQDEGVLLAANEAFFWPIGLALTWSHDKETGEASDLHVRQWVYEDGHVESIVLSDDELEAERHRRYAAWRSARIERMPEEERP